MSEEVLIFSRKVSDKALLFSFMVLMLAFPQMYRVRFVGLIRVAHMLVSTNMAWWSLIPGVAVQRLTSCGRLVRKRSSILSPLVGKSTICVRPSSGSRRRNCLFIAFLYWCPLIALFDQLISGRLKSPAIQIVAFLNVLQMCEMALNILHHY